MVVLTRPIPAGASIVVDAGFRFHAFTGANAWSASPEGYKIPDTPTWVLEPGRHVAHAADLGAWIRTEGVATKLGGPLSPLAGGVEAKMDLDARVIIEDPLTIVKTLGLSKGLATKDVADGLMQQAITNIVDRVLAEHVGSGTWTIDGLAGGAQLPDFCRAVERAFATDANNPYRGAGLRIAGARLAFAAAPPRAALASNARVIVTMQDGNRQPGIVQQVAPGQVLVRFLPSGAQSWVPVQYVKGL